MSANLVSKTLIDLLLTAAVKWGKPDAPFSYYWYRSGARPVTAESAARVGLMLWRLNWEATEGAADREDRFMPDPPDYSFEPLAGLPAPLVVLRQISYYLYQTTGDDVQAWLLSEVRAFLDALTGAAHAHLDGLDDVPWGVGDSGRDVFLRFGGPDPSTPAPPLDTDDPQWAVVSEQLAATGLPFIAVDRKTPHHGVAPEDQHGEWHARWHVEGFMPSASVYLLATEDDAKLAYDAALAHVRAGGPHFFIAFLRSGRVVVRLIRHPAIAAPEWWFEHVLEAFADADADWHKDTSLTPHGGAEVIATRVPLTKAGEEAENRMGGAAIIARDTAMLTAMAEMIDDAALAARVARINIDTTAVIMLTTIGAVKLDGQAHLENLGQLSTEASPRLQLDIGVEHIRRKTGTLIAIDALDAQPADVFLIGRARLPVISLDETTETT